MKKYIGLLFVIVFFQSIAIGQLNFLPHIINGDEVEIEGSSNVISADIDNDGDLDLIVAGRSLAWFENIDGLGTFGKQNNLPSTLIFIKGISVADLDGDGDDDIIATSNGDFQSLGGAAENSGVAWYENTGNTIRFETEKKLDIECIYCRDVNVLDTDNDGDLDILVLQRYKLSLLDNVNGDFNFSSHLFDFADVKLFDIVDVDNDGLEDIVIGSSGSLTWTKNLGNSEFSETFTKIATTPFITSFSFFDSDNDGDLDAISSSLNGGDVLFHENLDGEGLFTSDIIDMSGSYFVSALDLDNDQDVDVIASDLNNGLIWYEKTDIFFENPISINNESKQYNDIIIADLDNNGLSDIVASSVDEREIVWFKNLGDGLISNQNIVNSNISTSPSGLIISDVDDDGYNDVLYHSIGIKKAAWQRNTGQEGEFDSPLEIFYKPSFFNISHYAYPIDMDSDGDTDILVSSSKSNVLSYYENIDNQDYLISEITVGGSTSLGRLITHDMDQDGDLDIFYSTNDDDEFGVFENVEGILGPLETNKIGYADRNVQLDFGDINGDGFDDLVVTSSAWEYIKWHRYIPSMGRFSNFIRVDNTYSVGRVRTIIKDLDNDGDNDLISSGRKTISSESTSYLEWYENTDGLGTWDEAKNIYEIDLMSNVNMDVDDLDNDGDNDIAMVVDDLNSLFVFENLDGAANFDDGALVADDLEFVREVLISDIDKDGKNDLVTLSLFEKRVMWFENGGRLKNRIGGNAYISIDSFYCDSLQLGVGGVHIQLIDESGNNLTQLTNPQGYFEFKVDSGSYELIVEDFVDFDVVEPIKEVNLEGQDSLATSHVFCLDPLNPTVNVSISIISLSESRPGFTTDYRLILQNTGNSWSSGTVRFVFDQEYQSFIQSSIDPLFSDEGILEFEYQNLYPYQTQSIEVKLINETPPILVNGDILYLESSITPDNEDIDDVDNMVVLEQEVVGSYDPNDISVAQGKTITKEDAQGFLQYLIRFQNTGTVDAINVRVENVLEDDLDWSSFSLIELSHPGVVQIANGDSITFVFNGIYLPDSTTNEPLSHGYISYKIKPKEESNIGTVFSNVADIYFDFNPPVITNTVHTEIIEPSDVDEIGEDKLWVSSLVSDIITIKSEIDIEKIEIYPSSLEVHEVSVSQLSIDVSEFNNGIYFVKILFSNGVSVTKKVVKF